MCLNGEGWCESGSSGNSEDFRELESGDDFGAALGSGRDGELTATGAKTLAHAHEAKTRRVGGRIEANAEILDGETNRFAVLDNIDENALGMTVLYDVGKGLLSDAEKAEGNIGREFGIEMAGLEIDIEVVIVGVLAAEILEGNF